MRFEKEMTIAAPREKVWAFLWDLPRLAACVPGCHEARVVEEARRYAATVRERVGPIKVEFPLEIEVLETRPPEHMRGRAVGRDPKVDGLVKIELDLRLVDAGVEGTALRFVVDLVILGKLGTMGHGIIVRKADEVVAQFAAAVKAQLEGSQTSA